MAEKKSEKKSEKKIEEKTDDERLKLIEAQMKSLGIPRSCLVVGEDFNKPIVYYPTGIVEIDSILGEGMGIPDGTEVEFCGEPQSGKTHVGLSLIASAQKMGRKKRGAFMNVENSFFEPRAQALGVDTRDKSKFLMIKEVSTAEKWGDLIVLLTESGDYDVIVVDSISALVPEVEIKKSLGDNPKIGVHAQFINRFQKKLLQACSTTGTIVVLINQFRMGAGRTPLDLVKTPTGGAGVGYLTHMRLWFDRIHGAAGDIIGGDDDEKIGGKSRVFLAKTRFGEPEQTAVFPIFYKAGEVNPLGEFLYLAQARGKEYIKVIRKKYHYIDKITGEILAKSDNPVQFTKELFDIAPPTDKPKKDTSENVFEYICNRLNYDNVQKQAILDRLEKDEMATDFEAPDDLNDIEPPDKIVSEDED
jgi:recombination protein RecA